MSAPNYLSGFSGLLRRIADRIDYAGAPRAIGYTFTFEQGEGLRFREDGKGCPLWYLGDDDYERAHAEADKNGDDGPSEEVQEFIEQATHKVPDRGHLEGKPVRLTLYPWATQGPTEGIFNGQGERGLSILVKGGGRFTYSHHEVAEVLPT